MFFGPKFLECKEAFEEFVQQRLWEEEFNVKFPGVRTSDLEITDDISAFVKIDKKVFKVVQFGCCDVLKHAEFGSYCLAVLLKVPNTL